MGSKFKKGFFLLVVCPTFLLAQSNLCISEFMAWNTGETYGGLLDSPSDWIEIYNAGSQIVSLDGYALSDNPEKLSKYIFPPGIQIDPHAYILLVAEEEGDTYDALCTGFKLDAGGEYIILSTDDHTVVDSFKYPRQFENVSCGRDTAGNFIYFDQPSPMAANDTLSGYKYAIDLTWDPVPGFYEGSVILGLSSSIQNAVIRYTLNGDEPDSTSVLYTQPISVDTTTTIRAKVWAEGYRPGWAQTGTYLLNEDITLPVVALATAPKNLWDDETGIYVTGTNGITGYCSDEPKNYNQDWERPVSFEYFLSGQKRILHADAGIKIFGGCSRGRPMKSLAIYRRNKYGGNDFNYPFFKEKNDLDYFKDIVLRNSGNDNTQSMMRDATMQAVVKGAMDIDAQAYQPVIVFINGVYWGIHNLREKLNEHYIKSNYGIEPEEIDLLEDRHEIFTGDRDGYNQLIQYLKNHALSDPAHYQEVCKQVDMPELINYLVSEMYFTNTDWPGNNQKYWQPRGPGGKFRWILFDLDFGMNIWADNTATDMFSFTSATGIYQWPNPEWSTFLFRKLLESELFQNDFIHTYNRHLNTTFRPERVNRVIDSVYNLIVPEMARHIDRWETPWGWDFWMNEIGDMRYFANTRPGYVRENMCSFFDLGQPLRLEVQAFDSAARVGINDFIVQPDGMTMILPSGMTHKLTAYPPPGFNFDRWQVMGIEKAYTTILHRGGAWKFNDSGIYPGSGWHTTSFNDGSWDFGHGFFGYGDGNETTVLDYGPDPGNKYISYYFRKEIDIIETEKLHDLIFRLMRDDGVVVYVNGEEVLRVNMPGGTIDHWTTASNFVGGADETRYFEYALSEVPLHSGVNLIAVEVHQSSPTSSDLKFDLEIEAARYSTPDTQYYREQELFLDTREDLVLQPVFKVSESLPELYINEFMASNRQAWMDHGTYPDWIELYNAGVQEVNIGGYYVTDNLGDPFKWRIPDDQPAATMIPAKGYYMLIPDRDTLEGPNHLDFKLSKDGEEIGLSTIMNNTFYWVDTITFGPQISDVSYGRYPDGSDNWYFMEQYTPLASNIAVTNIELPGLELGVRIYPNPAQSFLVVEMQIPEGMPEDQLRVAVYNLQGSEVLSLEESVYGREHRIQLDIASLPAGFYLMKLQGYDQQRTIRFIKQ